MGDGVWLRPIVQDRVSTDVPRDRHAATDGIDSGLPTQTMGSKPDWIHFGKIMYLFHVNSSAIYLGFSSHEYIKVHHTFSQGQSVAVVHVAQCPLGHVSELLLPPRGHEAPKSPTPPFLPTSWWENSSVTQEGRAAEVWVPGDGGVPSLGECG